MPAFLAASTLVLYEITGSWNDPWEQTGRWGRYRERGLAGAFQQQLRSCEILERRPHGLEQRDLPGRAPA